MKRKGFRELERIDKFHFILTSFIRIVLVVAIFFGFLEGNYFVIFISALTFLLTFVPNIFERTYRIELPAEFQIIILFFIYAGVFLGGAQNYYYIYWWWDSMLHFLGGIALGFIGFLILYVLYKSDKFRASAKWIVIFSFCFALALGALWEIFEFSVDEFLGYNMQKARDLDVCPGCDTRLGVVDTMRDLILDSIGALIASVAGYFYLKKGRVPLLTRFVKSFEKNNPKLFRKNRSS
jgi:hypothetical protein